MNYSVEVNEEEGYVSVAVSGSLNVDTVTELTTEVGAVAKKHSIDRFLFDVRKATEDTGIMEAFSLASTPEKRGLTRGQRRAVLHNGDPKLYRFFETVSKNRGYDVRIFTDMALAIEWLQDDD